MLTVTMAMWRLVELVVIGSWTPARLTEAVPASTPSTSAGLAIAAAALSATITAAVAVFILAGVCIATELVVL